MRTSVLPLCADVGDTLRVSLRHMRVLLLESFCKAFSELLYQPVKERPFRAA